MMLWRLRDLRWRRTSHWFLQYLMVLPRLVVESMMMLHPVVTLRVHGAHLIPRSCLSTCWYREAAVRRQVVVMDRRK